MDEMGLETEAAATMPDGFYLREAREGCLEQDRTYVQDKAGCAAVALLSFGKSFVIPSD